MKSTDPGEDIAEFHGGKTYARTKKKSGKKAADKQAVAAGIHAATRAKRGGAKRAQKRA